MVSRVERLESLNPDASPPNCSNIVEALKLTCVTLSIIFWDYSTPKGQKVPTLLPINVSLQCSTQPFEVSSPCYLLAWRVVRRVGRVRVTRELRVRLHGT